MRVILLLDGPLKGTPHEVAAGWPVPAKLALPDERGSLHWYKVQEDGKTACFEKSEPERKGR